MEKLHMKRLLMVIGLVLVSIPAFTFAGDSERQHGGGDRMAQMQERLGLSDEQVEQLRQIRENGGSREEMKAVFTEEQHAMMKERRAQKGGMGHQGKGRGKGKHRSHEQGHEQQPAPADESVDEDTSGN